MCYPVPLSNQGYKDKQCTTNVFKSFKGYIKVQREGRAISRQNLNKLTEFLHLAPNQFCHLPGFNSDFMFMRLSFVLDKSEPSYYNV